MRGILIARIRGIDVRVNWSVVVIASLIAVSLAETVFPETAEGYSSGEYWAAAVLATIAFFAALVAHEFGHSLVALNAGVNVTTVTLWLFGGVAQLEESPTSPRTTMRIAVAGPAVSLALGVLGLTVSLFFGGLVGASFAWFGLINLILAGFNLLPAFPMDGGRLFQAWRWERTGDELQATKLAVDIGLWIGAGLVGLGLLEMLAGGTISGLWLMLIGWFLREAARAELRHVQVERPLGDISVSEIMSADPMTVEGDATVAHLISGMVYGNRHAAYPVVGPDGTVSGLITVNALRAVSQADWATTPVDTVADPLDQVITVSPDTAVAVLAARLGRREQHRALVMENGRLVGIVAPSDIARLVAVLDVLGNPTR